MKTMIERTVDLHKNGGLNCAQALLTAFGASCGLDDDRARALGRPLGGGIARSAGMCGYLAAALLIISQAHTQKDESASRAAYNDQAQRLLERFHQQHGTFLCRELLGADISTAEGRRRISEEKLIARHCYAIGDEVARLLTSTQPVLTSLSTTPPLAP